MNVCRICGNGKNNREIMLNATMYGTKGQYGYFCCSSCGCLQIAHRLADISEFYAPDQYYSFRMKKRVLKNKLLFWQLCSQAGRRNPAGRLVEFFYPVDYRYVKYLGRQDKLLDLGCGDGEFLRWLKKLGYRDVHGMDPFVPGDIMEDGECLVRKADIQSAAAGERYKMVTMLHSLEHIYEQQETIKAIDRVLEPGGYLVVQIPYLSRYYWARYRENLSTLDPPRHYYIHTRKSMLKLMETVGYRLIRFDTEFDAAVPKMSRNAARGKTEKNQGTGLVSGMFASLASRKLRRELKEKQDGAIATFVFQKQQAPGGPRLSK